MKRATEALVKAAQQVKEREDEANVQVNKRLVGGVAQVRCSILSLFLRSLASPSHQTTYHRFWLCIYRCYVLSLILHMFKLG